MASLFSKLHSKTAKSPQGGRAEPLAEPGTIPAYSADPTYAWDKEKVRQVVKEVQPVDWRSEKPANHTRFVCLSGEKTM